MPMSYATITGQITQHGSDDPIVGKVVIVPQTRSNGLSFEGERLTLGAISANLDAGGRLLDPSTGTAGVKIPLTGIESLVWRFTVYPAGAQAPWELGSYKITGDGDLADADFDPVEVIALPSTQSATAIMEAAQAAAEAAASSAAAAQTGAIGSLVVTSVDTGAQFRLIGFSNGTVKIIPVATPSPVAPTGLARTVKIASVTLTWTAATTPAASYDVYRDGVKIGSSTGLSYRDGTVVAGATYSYQVRTVDSFAQTSPLTAAVTAFVDPTLNVAPTAVVTSWPASAPTNGKTLLRVCASDPDAQTLSLALGVDSGSLTPTDDPSIWYYTPGA